MAKITITGDVAVITSEMKLEEIEKLEKYNRNALTLFDNEGKEPEFCVKSSTKGSINRYGAEFNGKSRDEGFATITIPVKGETKEEVEAYLLDKTGNAILNVNKIEEQAIEALAKVDEEIAEVKSNITIG